MQKYKTKHMLVESFFATLIFLLSSALRMPELFDIIVFSIGIDIWLNQLYDKLVMTDI